MNDLQKLTIDSYNKSAKNYLNSIAKLPNYHWTYDFFMELVPEKADLLDLACGPAQISKYIRTKRLISVVGVDLSESMLEIAKSEIPDGIFYQEPIQGFIRTNSFNAIVIGFGLPYLNDEQVLQCLQNSWKNLKENGVIYLSFMQGSGSKIEKTSFGGDNNFLIYYHDRRKIELLLNDIGFGIKKIFEIDYLENDNSITKDIVIIAYKIN